MKRSMLAVAALGAFTCTASAQSAITIYGVVDLSVGKNPNSSAKYMANGQASRLGFRGVEDLGGGLQALFNIEHRFEADTGAVTGGADGRFWRARALVGLQGGFGQVTLGRDYTTTYLMSQLVPDPWGNLTVVAGTNGTTPTGANTGAPGSVRGFLGIVTGGIGRIRNDSAATYRITASGFTFAAQVAEATDAIMNYNSKPVNFGLSYDAGPLTIGLGYERTGFEGVETEKWMTLNAGYKLGVAKISGLIGRGDTASGIERNSWLLAAAAPVGAGEVRIGYGQLESEPVGAGGSAKHIKTFAVGYHYYLSKRTSVYTDFVRENGSLITTSKNGYDFGIRHNF